MLISLKIYFKYLQPFKIANSSNEEAKYSKVSFGLLWEITEWQVARHLKNKSIFGFIFKDEFKFSVYSLSLKSTLVIKPYLSFNILFFLVLLLAEILLSFSIDKFEYSSNKN